MCISDIIDLISSVSVVTASILGIWGVNAWRKETRFKRKYELAEKVLANAYEAVDVIQLIRSPFGKKNEGQTRKLEKGETPQETLILNNLYVIKERYIENIAPFKEIYSIRYNIKAVMGKEIEKPLNLILQMPRKIFNCVDQYADLLINKERYSKEERIKLTQKYSKMVYAGLINKEEDPIYNEMKEALKDLEKECRKYLN